MLQLAQLNHQALVELRFLRVGPTLRDFPVDNVIKIVDRLAERVLQKKCGHGFLKIVE